MNKSNNSPFYSTYSQEYSFNFFAIANHFSKLKANSIELSSQIAFLFQEKLPIIYANIRV
jgi:hypothetical protein